MVTPAPFEPDRFRSTAALYEAGRVAYAPALIRRVAQACALKPAHRVLDLGCGPGPLARGFAPLVALVVAIDPEPAMLAEAQRLAAGMGNIRFERGSSYDLGPATGRYFLAVMGRSFHWMDREDTLRRLDTLVEPGGAVALFRDSWPEVPENAWLARFQAVRRAYEGDDATHARRSPGWVPHETVLLASAFSVLERFGVVERRAVTAEALVARALSMSSTSPARLGGRAEAFAVELRAALAGVRSEVVETSALVAWRRGSTDHR